MRLIRDAISALRQGNWNDEADAVQSVCRRVNELMEETDKLKTALAVQTELLADANAQLNAMREERDELRSVIEQAHHVVCTQDRVWGGTSWVLHPLSTVSRAHLRRVLEGHARPKHL